MLLCASCASCPDVAAPPIDWPVWPAIPEGLIMKDGMVVVPLDYWLAVVEYAVSVRRVQDSLE